MLLQEKRASNAVVGGRNGRGQISKCDLESQVKSNHSFGIGASAFTGFALGHLCKGIESSASRHGKQQMMRTRDDFSPASVICLTVDSFGRSQSKSPCNLDCECNAPIFCFKIVRTWLAKLLIKEEIIECSKDGSHFLCVREGI
jgi:hypothetical protein